MSVAARPDDEEQPDRRALGPAVSPGIERTLALLAHQPPRAEVLEPFLEAARDVVAQELGSDVVPGKVILASGAATTLDVTVVVGITDKLTGIAVFGMPTALAMEIVGRMLGAAVPELDDLALSALAELANVITGRATTLLAARGLASTVSPPVVLLGAGSRLSVANIHRLDLPLTTSLGTVEVQVAIKVTGQRGR